MPPHPTCFKTVHDTRQPGATKSTKMRVWEFSGRTRSKFGGPWRSPVPSATRCVLSSMSVFLAIILATLGKWPTVVQYLHPDEILSEDRSNEAQLGSLLVWPQCSTSAEQAHADQIQCFVTEVAYPVFPSPTGSWATDSH